MTLTATADTEAPLVPPAEPAALATAEAPLMRAGERPVFAATTPARPRALKLAGRVTAGLVGLWLVALVLGTFGFGPVAGIGLPRIDGGAGDVKPQRDPVARAPATAKPGDRVTRSGVTLTNREGSGTAIPATGGRGSSPAGTTRRSATRQGPAGGSTPIGGNGGSRSNDTVNGGNGGSTTSGGNTPQTQANPPSGSSTATPTSSTPAATTTTTPTNGNPAHSQATPPGSSSTAPGSRSNAGTAPGREQSASSPSPGSGRSEHAPPKG